MTLSNALDREIDAVVFDLDGTLVHTTVDFRTMKQRLIDELARRGVHTALLDPQDTIVANLDRSVDDLISRGRGGEVGDLRREVGRLMNITEMEKVSETRAIDGAEACLKALKERGLRIGLLTRGSRAYANAALRAAGLDISFDALVCRDDHPEEEAKPNGKAMARAAALLNTDPTRCLVVGDHLMDLTCARSVGAQFVGVLTGSFGQAEWSLHDCPVLLPSVSELPALLGIGKV